MSKKVKLAIFDNDLKARTVGKFPVSESGDRIQVKQGGKEHFKPSFDNESFIEFPRRAFPFFWRIVWDRVYFARKGASSCVNFQTGKVEGPDPALVIEAAGTEMLRNLGKEKTETALTTYIMLALLLFITLNLLGVI